MCVGTCRFATCCFKTHYNGCMTLHGACVGEKAGARNRVFFRVKWLQPAMKGTLCVCGGCGCARFINESVVSWCSATRGCSCVRSSMRFLNLWLQIALEWLHDCCHLLLPLKAMAASGRTLCKLGNTK